MKNCSIVLFLLTNLIFSINCSETSIKAKTIVDLFKGLLNGYQSSPSNSSPNPVSNIDQNKILTELEKLSVSMENWLKISDPSFKDQTKYPPIILSDYSVKKLKLNSEFFRVNENFDENAASNGQPGAAPNKYYFWFRVSDKNIFYSVNKADNHILGSIQLKNIISAVNYNDPNSSCLVLNGSGSNIRLCAESNEIRKKWKCYINKMVSFKDDECISPDDAGTSPLVVESKVTTPIVLIPLPSLDCNDKWNYDHNGKDWNCDCSEGKTQSPIDIHTLASIASKVKPIFKYEEVSPPSDKNSQTTLDIELFHNVIRIKYDNFGKVVTLDGSIYTAQEIRIHTPSQHKLNGEQLDMEVEIIHRGESQEVIAQNLILCFLFRNTPGEYNSFFDDLDYFNLPTQSYKSRPITRSIYIPRIFYPSESEEYAVMKPFDFFTYQGSLTAPPCTERTIVYVAANPIPIGNTIVQLFKEALKSPDQVDSQGNISISTKEFSNNREVQTLNNRKVYFYDSSPDKLEIPGSHKKAKRKGHYEKLQQKLTNYFHVDNAIPSGLPGSFLVSEKEANGQQ